MADASTPGRGENSVLTQGYGALVFAEPEFQKKHPCYVLVPEFSGVAVNDSFERTVEVDMVERLVESLTKTLPVNPARLYTTGQSMGGMISMYLMLTYQNTFAAGMFVDCFWDPESYPKLLDKKFIFFAAGPENRSGLHIEKLLTLLRNDELPYSLAEWTAKLPETKQNALATKLLNELNPINFIIYSFGSVLPEDGKGSEHMYSFDYAYKIRAARDWLLSQKLKVPVNKI